MLKASIALVGVAFAALAVGWVTGLDPLLYASIVCSALGGIALLKSTLADRKRRLLPGEEAEAAKPGKKEKKRSRPDAKKQKKLSRRDAKKQKKSQPALEEELLEETSSVRAIEGTPAGAASTLGHDHQVASGHAHLGEHAGVASADSSGDSVVDFRSRLAAALDTSSLEDQLLLEDEEEDDGLLASRLRANDAMASALAEIDDEVIEAEPEKEEEEDEAEEEELAFVRAPGDLESSVEASEEEDALDWIRIDDLPRIAESFRLTRGSREAATRSSSVSAARRTPAGSTTARTTAGRTTAGRPASSRLTANKAKDRSKPSPAGKASARKTASGAKPAGAGQSRASSKPKQASSRAASDSSPTRKRAASTAGAKPASKSAQPRVTGAKRSPGRPPKAKP